MTQNTANIEYEAMFTNIDVNTIRQHILQLGGVCKKEQYNQKRTVFSFPEGHEIAGGFLRVRDESGKITMTLKIMENTGSIDGQKEIELQVDSYDQAVAFLATIGAKEKAQQETKRELWHLDDCEIMIDWWPFLDPVIEIEGPSESAVQGISNKLGFDWSTAIFDSIDAVYSIQYNISKDRINNHTPKICFDMENPFI